METTDYSKTKMPVLMVDDHSENLYSYELALQNENIKSKLCGSGEEALKVLSVRKNFGLILMDINMPGIDGIETAKRIKKDPSTAHIPIIFITGNRDSKDWLNLGYDTGALDYIVKPIDDEILKHKVRNFREVYIDRIKLKNLNQLLETQSKNLEKQYNKLEVKSKEMENFAAIISHDLRTPTNNLIQISDLLEDIVTEDSDGEVLELVEMIKTASTRMSTMVNEVFDYCKTSKEELNIEPVSISDLMEEILNAIDIPQHVTIHKKISKIESFESSKIGLTQIFQNLISNAIKYGKVDNLEITISVEEDFMNNQLKCAVKDNGVGIDPKYHSKIFEMMNTGASYSQDSTGIGLAIVKNLVEKLKGTISLESELGKGSNFCFTIGKNF